MRSEIKVRILCPANMTGKPEPGHQDSKVATKGLLFLFSMALRK